MKLQNLIVPSGIRYISDWKEYDLANFPFPHILNKTLTGCGFTEYCLTNSQDLILLSPRRMLLENKESQHPGEVFYARNDTEKSINFDCSLNDKNRIEQTPNIVVSNYQQRILDLKQNILNYYFYRKRNKQSIKIIVTYDSFRHVRETLIELMGLTNFLNEFQVVIDEFQSVLIDVKFKVNTEIELLYQLQDLQKVCFVSATPMLDKYLDKLDEFKNLPYFQLDWISEESGRIINPNLKVHKTMSISKDLSKIIDQYLSGDFAIESWIGEDGLIHEKQSKEAVIYVNSVKTICNIISKHGLTLDNTNILCARTSDNEEKLRKALNKNSSIKIKKGSPIIGNIPRRGEPHKMFTFCTRTVYLGADFYSTNARTFIFSDSNIDCLSVDISLDLPQILGRQRLDENPWKNCADLYVKSTILELTKEDFDREIANKIKKTNNLLLSYESSPTIDSKHDLAEAYESRIKSLSYKEDYVAINHHGGKDLFPVFNQLMLVADERSFDIQQIDYKNRVSVFNTLNNSGYTIIEVDQELYTFNSISYFHDKMRYVCELGNSLNSDRFELFLNSIPKEFKNYYTILGPSGCSACSFKNKEMEREYKRRVSNQGIDISSIIYSNFNVGERYLYTNIKKILETIYSSNNYEKTPKAKDIEEFFEVKHCQVTNRETGKREHGYLLLNKKL